MNEVEHYTVEIGEVARTVIYKDAWGTLCFALEIEPAPPAAGAQWSVQISSNPEVVKRARRGANDDDSWKTTAAERVKRYLSSRGYYVEGV